MIRAKSQYLPPVGKTNLETSYSATFNWQAPLQPADNKALERRRIRSLYSEPYMDPTKQVRLVFSCFQVQAQITGAKPFYISFSCFETLVKLILCRVFASASYLHRSYDIGNLCGRCTVPSIRDVGVAVMLTTTDVVVTQAYLASSFINMEQYSCLYDLYDKALQIWKLRRKFF